MSLVLMDSNTDFVCINCHFKSPGRTVGGFKIGEAFQYARDVLEARPYRFCELCLAQVPHAPDFRFILPEGNEIWACASCSEKLRDGLAEYSPKRRYLEQVLQTEEQLRAGDIAQEAHRLDIEETLDNRLKAERPERDKAALQEIERIHGEKPERAEQGNVSAPR
jgi:hypothetical protein